MTSLLTKQNTKHKHNIMQTDKINAKATLCRYFVRQVSQ
jgi:hypothetical protein